MSSTQDIIIIELEPGQEVVIRAETLPTPPPPPPPPPGIYVSVKGTGTGSKDNPASLPAALTQAKPGDSIFLLPGTYPPIRPKLIGQEGMPITLRPVEPGTAIFDGGVTFKTSYGGVIDLRDCQYVVLDSLTITRSGWFGVLAERSKYIQIINCDISWCYASGIMCDRCEDVLVSACNLQKCTHGVPDQAAPNEWISMRGVHRFTVQTCHLHNPHLVNGTKVGKEGIDAKTGSMDGIIENNIVQDMRRLGIYVDAYDAGCTNILVRSNLVERCQHGIVLSSERGGDLENITVVSNVCQDNQYHGLWVAHDPDDLTGEMFNITVRSNTSTQNQGVGIRISNPNLHNCTITDNDLTQNAKGPVQWSIKDKSGVTYANNRES